MELYESEPQRLAGAAKRRCTDKLETAWQDYDSLVDDVKSQSSEWDAYADKVKKIFEEYIDDVESVYGYEEGSESRYKQSLAESILDILYAGKKHGQKLVPRTLVNKMLGPTDEKRSSPEHGSEWYVLEYEKRLISKEIYFDVPTGSKISWSDVKVGYYLTKAGEEYVEFNNIYRG